MPYFTAGSVFHAQENPSFCGAAAILTMLSDSDSGLKAGNICEQTVFDLGCQHSDPDFLIDPDGLVFVLNQSGANKKFKFFKSLTEKKGSASIVANVCGKESVAVAALVYGRRHWVTVNGVEVDRDPFAGAYTLLKLWVYDPEAVSFPAPLHSDSDDCPNLGVKDYCVFYCDGWQDDMYTGTFFGDLQVFVSVAALPIVEVKSPKCIEPLMLVAQRDSEGFLVPEELSAVWNAWIKAYGGWPDESPGIVLRNTRPVSSNKVRWIERDKTFILSLLEKSNDAGASGPIVGTCILDAQSGAPHSVKIYSERSVYRGALERLQGDLLGVEFVWLPCLESFSPHLPFRVVETGFERLDGRMFAKLTTEIAGA